jgi:hypothetical protein
MENKRSSEDGRKMLEEFERSGLTRREFCEQNNVPSIISPVQPRACWTFLLAARRVG